MSRNNTGNPIGSKAFADFEDNVKNLDEAVNTADPQWVDRFGRFRLPLMEQERQFVSDQERRDGEFQADQSSREAVFSDFLQGAGYQDLGEYAPGIEITAHNQYVTFGGQPYLLKPSIPVPYTTSGVWTGDDFKLIGDDALRQDLANPDIGAAMVARGVVAVDGIADLLALPVGQRKEGLTYLVKGYHPPQNYLSIPYSGGGEFYWDSSSVEADDYGTVLAVPGVTEGRFKKRYSASITAESFGVVSGSVNESAVAENTARMQSAWDFSGRTGVCINYMSDSLSSPYYVGRLLMRSGLKMKGNRDKTAICLHPSLWGMSGFFLSREDDGLRYYRGEIENVTFATSLSGVTAAQDANQDLGGACHVAMESWEWSNVAFSGFGQGGVVVARAEGGAEGLGFVNTVHDGNYNNFYNIRTSACGKYRTDEQSRGGIVLLYKANSNNFYGLYCRGSAGSSVIALVYASNNNVFGGAGESLEYPVRMGRMAHSNHVFGMRGENVDFCVRAYLFEGNSDAGGPRSWNTVQGVHLSTATGEILSDAGHNVSMQGTLRNPLTFPSGLSSSPATRADGLLKVLGLKCDDVNGSPVYIMSTGEDGRETNGPQYVPRIQLRSNVISGSAGQLLGRVEFFNSDSSAGASGVSASIDAVLSGSSGNTDLVFSTGTGSNMVERLRIKANGSVNFSNLPTSASGLSSGDIWSDAGVLKVVS